MAKYDIKEVFEDVKDTTIEKAIIKLLTLLGIAAVLMLTTHLDFNLSIILALIALTYIYLGRVELYGHTTKNKHK